MKEKEDAQANTGCCPAGCPTGHDGVQGVDGVQRFVPLSVLQTALSEAWREHNICSERYLRTQHRDDHMSAKGAEWAAKSVGRVVKQALADLDLPGMVPWASGDAERLAKDSWQFSFSQKLEEALQLPTLAEALSFLALRETERAIRQAFRNARSGERDADGKLWDTMFLHMFRLTIVEYGKRHPDPFKKKFGRITCLGNRISSLTTAERDELNRLLREGYEAYDQTREPDPAPAT